MTTAHDYLPPDDYAPRGYRLVPLEDTEAGKKKEGGDNALVRGWETTKRGAGIAGNLVMGDYDAAAQGVSDMADYSARNPQSAEQKEIMEAWQRGKGVFGSDGGFAEVGREFAKDWNEAGSAVGKLRSAARNVKGIGESIVEQTPNMVFPMLGMGAGAAAGGAAGSAVPIIGNTAGAALGGWAGASLGNAAVEAGGMVQEALHEAGINPRDKAAVSAYLKEHGDEILTKAGIKGAVIGAVDTATMGAASKLLGAPGRKAMSRALGDMGIDMADKAAVKTAMSTPEFAQRIAADAAYQASKKGVGNAARNVTAAAMEPGGEYAGEFLGTLAAGGDWSPEAIREANKEAWLEAVMSMGQSGITFAGQKGWQAIRAPRGIPGVQSDADTLMPAPDAPQQPPMLPAPAVQGDADVVDVEAREIPAPRGVPMLPAPTDLQVQEAGDAASGQGVGARGETGAAGVDGAQPQGTGTNQGDSQGNPAHATAGAALSDALGAGAAVDTPLARAAFGDTLRQPQFVAGADGVVEANLAPMSYEQLVEQRVAAQNKDVRAALDAELEQRRARFEQAGTGELVQLRGSLPEGSATGIAVQRTLERRAAAPLPAIVQQAVDAAAQTGTGTDLTLATDRELRAAIDIADAAQALHGEDGALSALREQAGLQLDRNSGMAEYIGKLKVLSNEALQDVADYAWSPALRQQAAGRLAVNRGELMPQRIPPRRTDSLPYAFMAEHRQRAQMDAQELALRDHAAANPNSMMTGAAVAAYESGAIPRQQPAPAQAFAEPRGVPAGMLQQAAPQADTGTDAAPSPASEAGIESNTAAPQGAYPVQNGAYPAQRTPDAFPAAAQGAATLPVEQQGAAPAPVSRQQPPARLSVVQEKDGAQALAQQQRTQQGMARVQEALIAAGFRPMHAAQLAMTPWKDIPRAMRPAVYQALANGGLVRAQGQQAKQQANQQRQQANQEDELDALAAWIWDELPRVRRAQVLQRVGVATAALPHFARRSYQQLPAKVRAKVREVVRAGREWEQMRQQWQAAQDAVGQNGENARIGRNAPAPQVGRTQREAIGRNAPAQQLGRNADAPQLGFDEGVQQRADAAAAAEQAKAEERARRREQRNQGVQRDDVPALPNDTGSNAAPNGATNTGDTTNTAAKEAQPWNAEEIAAKRAAIAASERARERQRMTNAHAQTAVNGMGVYAADAKEELKKLPIEERRALTKTFPTSSGKTASVVTKAAIKKLGDYLDGAVALAGKYGFVPYGERAFARAGADGVEAGLDLRHKKMGARVQVRFFSIEGEGRQKDVAEIRITFDDGHTTDPWPLSATFFNGKHPQLPGNFMFALTSLVEHRLGQHLDALEAAAKQEQATPQQSNTGTNTSTSAGNESGQGKDAGGKKAKEPVKRKLRDGSKDAWRFQTSQVQPDAESARILQGAPVAQASRADKLEGSKVEVASAAAEIFRQQGGMASRADIGAALLDERAAKNSAFHSKPLTEVKRATFGVLQRVIEDGALIAHAWHGAQESFYISAPVMIDDVENIVTVTLRHESNRLALYIHSVIEKKNLLPGVSVAGATGSNAGAVGSTSGTEDATGGFASVPDGIKNGKYERAEIRQRLRELLTMQAASDGKAAPAGEQKKKPAPKKKGIEDFGEKLGGARKDKAAKAKEAMERELSNSDIANLPMSEIFPASVVDAIEDVPTAALVKAMRDIIPRKPRGVLKVRWAAQVQQLRGLAQDLVSGRFSVEQMHERLLATGSTGLAELADKARLLEQVPREHWGRIGEVYTRRQYTPQGYNIPDGTASLMLDGKLVGGIPQDELADRVRRLLEKDAPQKPTLQLEVRYNASEGVVFICKKGDRLQHRLKTFPYDKDGGRAALQKAANEATAFIKEHISELDAAWEKVKERENVQQGDERGAENRPRVGNDWRGGKDATPEMFMQRFGFRGVEFGNWVGQGKGAKERQGLLNQAFDALMDLADMLGIDSRAVSLNGSLGLSFGARGKGGKNAANAHFEPGNLVIALTKNKGAGALAHEWFHALDNYFSRQRGKGHEHRFVTDIPELAKIGGTNVRPEMQKAFAALVRALDASPMAKRAENADKTRSTPYWSQTIERAARAFENYLYARLEQRGESNDFLANIRRHSDWQRAQETYPYLLPDEIAPIEQAFDALFKEMKQRETDRGVALFSRKKTVPEKMRAAAAEREFKETEKAYGGKAAYDAAKKADETRLTFRQWVQVRTPSFKRWFGNWMLPRKDFTIVDVQPATFNNTDAAVEWAERNGILGEMTAEETGGKGALSISKRAVREMLNPGQRDDRSVSREVHYAALTRIRDIIRESEIVDSHPDWNKDKDGNRTPKAGVNPGVYIDVLYGAVRFGGNVYRARTTVKRFADKNTPNKAHAYSVEKVEVLAGQDLAHDANATHPSASTPASILLQGVRNVNHETGEPGALVLEDFSKLVGAETGEPMVVYHGTPKGGFYVFHDGMTFFSNSSEVAGTYSGLRPGIEKATKPDDFVFFREPDYVVIDAYGDIVGEYDTMAEAQEDARTDEGERASIRYAVDTNGWMYDSFDKSDYFSAEEAMRAAFEVASGETAQNYAVFLNARNVEIRNFDGNWDSYDVGASDEKPTEALAWKIVQENPDVDGIIYTNIADEGQWGEGDANGAVRAEDYIVFSPNQIKSATDNIGTFDAANPDIRFSRREQGDTANAARTEPLTRAQRSTVNRVRLMATSIRRVWVNAPQIEVAWNPQSEGVPEDVRALDAAMRSNGAEGTPEAVYVPAQRGKDGKMQPPKVIVFASQVSTTRDMVRVVVHEVLGHHGLRGAFGRGMARVLNELMIARRAEVVQQAREYGLLDTNKLPAGVDAESATDAQVWAAMSEEQREQAAEEVLAHLAETYPKLDIVRRAIAAIRTWLRQHVPGFGKVPVSDDEIIRSFILPAREWVERGRSGRSFTEWAMFSRASRDAKTGEPQKPKRRTLKAQMEIYREEIDRLRFDEDVSGQIRVQDDQGRTSEIRITPTNFSNNIGVASDGALFVRGENNIWSAATATALREEMRRVAEEMIPLVHESEMAQWQRDHDIWEAAELGKQLGLQARSVVPSDSTSRYVYLTRDDGEVLKVRAANHAQPKERGRVVGGFDSKIGKRHDPSHISIDPSSGATLDDALNLVRQFAKGEQVSLQDDGYTAPVPQLLQELLDAARDAGNENREVSLGKAAPSLVNLMRERGFPIYGDERHTADIYAMRFVLKNRAHENREGRLPITDADVRASGEVIRAPDAVVFRTKGKGKTKTLAYIKRMPDGAILYVEEVRTGSGALALKDMKKFSPKKEQEEGQGANNNPGALDVKTIASGLLPTDAQSDPGDVEIVPLNDAFRQLMNGEESGTSSRTPPSSGGGGGGSSNAPQARALFSRTKKQTPEQRADALRYGGAGTASEQRMSFMESALAHAGRLFTHPGRVSLWDKTIGTPRHLAERVPAFKPVYEAAMATVEDVSTLANTVMDAAPRWIPKLEGWQNLAPWRKEFTRAVSAKDSKAVAKPLFEGTLVWGRDAQGNLVQTDALQKKYGHLGTAQLGKALLRDGYITEAQLKGWLAMPQQHYDNMVKGVLEDVVRGGTTFTDAELREHFNLTDGQISLYREARAAIDASLDVTTRTDMLRLVQHEFGSRRDAWQQLRQEVLDAESLDGARKVIKDALEEFAGDATPKHAEALRALADDLGERVHRVQELMRRGYAPLTRFGRYTVDVVDKATGERLYFGMYESRAESNLARIKLAQAFQGAEITQGTLSEREFELFQGVTPETLELFGQALALDSEGGEAADVVFQEYLRRTKNNHSALKRMIHRKGIAGYSEDVGRVLASFIYSNARAGSQAMNAGQLERAITEIPKSQGQLKDLAVGLRDYLRNPREGGQIVRGFLFAQYLGGSVASALVNATQPFQVTMPWLSQFGGMAKAGRQMARALKDMPTGNYEPALAAALKAAEADGTVSPQEIHHLMAQARGVGSLSSGDGTKAGRARALAGNAWQRLKVAWGVPFSLAEQFNRRTTFIAAWRTATEQLKMGEAQAAEFARRAVQETQFVYSKGNKPVWARGTIGGALFTFKVYTVSYLELMHRMWTRGGKDGRRAVAWSIAMLLLVGGAGGLPFMEDAEDLIDGAGQLMGYNISTKAWRDDFLRRVLGEELGGFLENGVSGLPGAPIDVSGRLGMGNLIPGTGLMLAKQDRSHDLKEMAGAAGDFISRAYGGIKTGIRGLATGDVGELSRAALEVAPNAVKNALKGVDMFRHGMYRDQKGYKVIDTTAAEALAKLIGFQPGSVARVQEANSFMMRSKSFYQQKAAEIRLEWAQALFEKDETKLARVRQKLADWNRKNPDQRITVDMRAVWKRVREMNKSRSQRIADTAPKALRQQMRELAQEARGEAA